MTTYSSRCSVATISFFHYFDVRGPFVIPLSTLHSSASMNKKCLTRVKDTYDLEVYGNTGDFPCDVYVRQSFGISGLSTGRDFCDIS